MFRMHKFHMLVIQLANVYGGLWAKIFPSICEETVWVKKNVTKEVKTTSLSNLWVTRIKIINLLTNWGKLKGSNESRQKKYKVHGFTCNMFKFRTNFWTRLDVRNIFQHPVPSKCKITLPSGLVGDNIPYNWLAIYLYP